MTLWQQAGRFLLVGGLNTLLTLVLWIALAQVIDVRVAYTIVFVVGLAATTWATSSVVFGAALTPGRAARFVAWYLLVYAVGLAVVHALEEGTELADWLVAVLTLCVTAPLNFAGGRLVFGASFAASDAASPAPTSRSR